MNRFLIFLSLLILISGCQSESSKENSETTLLDTNWTLISYGYPNEEKSNVLINSSFTIVLGSSNRVNGTIDCNEFETTYTIDGEDIILNDIAPSENNCSGSGTIYYENYVSTIIDAFRTIATYTLTESKLTLATLDSMELVFGAAFEGCSEPVAITNADLVDYPSQYLVGLKHGVDAESYVNELQSEYDDLDVSSIFTSFLGFAAESSDQTLKRLQCDPNVESIAIDVPVSVGIQ